MTEKGPAHDDPDSVINDETQLSRYFSRQLTNAVRQQLRENPIITTTRTQIVTDYADKQIQNAVQAVLDGAKVSSTQVSTDHGATTNHCIYFDTLGVPSKIIGQLSAIRRDASDNGVIVEMNNNGICISRGLDCKTLTRTVTEKVNVTMLTPSQGNPDAPNPIEVPPEHEMDHVNAVASSDFMTAVDERLPNERCRALVQIARQDGPWFRQYVDRFDTDKFRFKNVELLLGLSKKEMLTVRTQCKAIMLELQED